MWRNQKSSANYGFLMGRKGDDGWALFAIVGIGFESLRVLDSRATGRSDQLSHLGIASRTRRFYSVIS